MLLEVYDRDRNRLVAVNSEGEGKPERLPNLSVEGERWVRVAPARKGAGGAYTLDVRVPRAPRRRGARAQRPRRGRGAAAAGPDGDGLHWPRGGRGLVPVRAARARPRPRAPRAPRPRPREPPRPRHPRAPRPTPERRRAAPTGRPAGSAAGGHPTLRPRGHVRRRRAASARAGRRGPAHAGEAGRHGGGSGRAQAPDAGPRRGAARASRRWR